MKEYQKILASFKRAKQFLLPDKNSVNNKGASQVLNYRITLNFGLNILIPPIEKQMSGT